MADTKLADLTALTTPSGDDILYIVDDPAGTPLDRKIALDNLFTRGTITADAPVLNMTQTWNNAAVTFTGLKLNITDTASASGSFLSDFQVGTNSKFALRNYTSGPYIVLDGNKGWIGAKTISTTNALVFSGVTNGADSAAVTSFGFMVSSGAGIGFSAGSIGSNVTADTILTRRGAANLRFGAADAAAPVAQTLSVQSVVAGTTNIAGANLTITGSQGTGTGAGGSIIFQVAPAGGSGTAQNALVDALTINSSSTIIQRGVGYNWHYKTTTNQLLTFEANGVGVGGAVNANGFVAVNYSFGSTLSASADLILTRDAANTLALRNGANAQEFRVYNTTDGTNSEFGSIKWVSNILSIGPAIAGTGTQREFSITRGGSTYMTTTSGSMSFPVNVSMSGELAIAAGDPYRWSTRSRMTSPADGIVAFNANTAANGSALQLTEMTAPAAPAANGVRIYAVDNGSGKTQLMALFATGAAQQIAIEP